LHYVHSGKANDDERVAGSNEPFDFVLLCRRQVSFDLFLNNFLVVLANLLKTLLSVSRSVFVLRTRRLRNENKNGGEKEIESFWRRVGGVGGSHRAFDDCFGER
jgi:hypothetical protein